MDHQKSFSAIEETISFYTRNDFAIINHLLIGDYEGLWKYAQIAYEDNRGIISEYEKGVRSIVDDYDIKWLNSLNKRILHNYDLKAKEIIIRNAENDIANILHAMYPAKETMHLYRTSWMDKVYTSANSFSYSREYPALQFSVGSMVEIKTISSCSLTPYRENDDVGSDFYRYEITVPCNMPILELDQFITHNEEGEVLLPPMRCKVIGIRTAMIGRRKGIVELEYVQSLS